MEASMSDEQKELALRVKALREQKGMSQEVLARRIGVSRPALSQIENGERRVTTGELVRLSKELNVSAGVLLGTETEPEVCLARDAKPAATELPMRINVPQKNLAKFREVLLYVLGKVGSLPNVGETVIYKLLYFVDFDYYEKYEEQLIGATYIRNKFGPTPVEFGKVVERMERSGELERVRSTFYKYPQTKYLPRPYCALGAGTDSYRRRACPVLSDDRSPAQRLLTRRFPVARDHRGPGHRIRDGILPHRSLLPT
jgi:transcriptional regulator with XRE-family HTH domain